MSARRGGTPGGGRAARRALATGRAVLAGCLFVAGSAAAADNGAASLETRHVTRTVAGTLPALSCDDLVPERLGLTKVGTLPRGAGSPEGPVVHAFREIPLARSGGDPTLLARDYAVVFAFDEPEHVFLAEDIVDGLVDRDTAFSDDIVCVERAIRGRVTLWSPLARPQGGRRFEVASAPLVVVIERRAGTAAPSAAGTASSAADTSALPRYAWTRGPALKDMFAGERVMALEKVECSKKGHFLVVSLGRLLRGSGTGAAGDAARVTLVRDTMVAANNYHGASGTPADRAAVEASLDPRHYWCIPRRELCYKHVPFGTFGLKLRRNRSGQVPLENAYNLRLGIVTALYRAAVDHCPEAPSTAAAPVAKPAPAADPVSAAGGPATPPLPSNP